MDVRAGGGSRQRRHPGRRDGYGQDAAGLTIASHSDHYAASCCALLQAIALVLAHPREPPSAAGPSSSSSAAAAAAPAGGTLVVVPVVALTQWRLEVLKWTAPSTLAVCTYHGPRREPLPEALARPPATHPQHASRGVVPQVRRGAHLPSYGRYDVVLTTYATLEYEYRTAQAPLKVERAEGNLPHMAWRPPSSCGHGVLASAFLMRQVRCAHCTKSFKNGTKLAFHNKWFCGPSPDPNHALCRIDASWM